jgi:hypothetical protein
MNILRKNWLLLGGLVVSGVAIIGIVLNAAAQTVPPPVISIALTNTNQLAITVTNGVSYGNYSLYNQHVLGSPTWTLVTNADPGVTNFLVGMGPYYEGFYYVMGSTNWNNNGIPNWDYADPLNPGLGVLTVTIVSPSQGQIIQ